jgi:hypothetical protein
MNAFQLRQQDNAFLFVGVRASDDRGDRFGLARVVRKVWYVGRDVEALTLSMRFAQPAFICLGRGIAEKILPGSNLVFRLNSLCPLRPNADPICSRASSSSRLA